MGLESSKIYSKALDTAFKELPKKTPKQIEAEKDVIAQNARKLASIWIEKAQIPELSRYLARFWIDANKILENQELIIAQSKTVTKMTQTLESEKSQEAVWNAAA